ncbi:hypothetical protein [Chryseobacterium sp. CT-SW4]|uniref:hypothetical protein n=1 Tax=Chryseobacterium sp. SW-1 TaxID=3157343 RepID=UPI003B02B7FE
MKKIMLLAAFGAVGLVSAKTTTEVKSKKVKVLKKIEKQKGSKKTETTWYAYTSCGTSAQTSQDWTAAQANEWLMKLEANYCGG